MEEDITQLLLDVEARQEKAFDKLLEIVYPALRDIAQARLRDQPKNITLQSTDLVHEAYLKLVRYQDVKWKGRTHFFGAAAQTMRRILVDRARSKAADKRSGEEVGLTMAGAQASVSIDELIEIDDALKRLEEIRPRWVRVVECRYFSGLNIEETAEFLSISHGTVSNDWRMARAWLKRELEG
ncbi:MAG: ECF-type sigma factor [Rhodothermales bacterium]